jgi:hypothetical protein
LLRSVPVDGVRPSFSEAIPENADKRRLTADGQTYVYSCKRIPDDLYIVEGLKWRLRARHILA